jgi:hypothetical protein
MANPLITADQIASLINAGTTDIYVREAMSATVSIDLPDDILVNDQTDQDALTHQFGWRAWNEPSQTDLNNDLMSPDNIWQPVYGDYVPLTNLTSDYLNTIKTYQSDPLVLNDGTSIAKYEAVWSDFVQLNDIVQNRIYDGSIESLTFSIGTSDRSLDTNRIFVYIDGVLQPAIYFSVSKLNVTILQTSPNLIVGSKLVVIYKKYQPTSADLAFDPDTNDNILINTQFKFSYDYTSFELRDNNGLLSDSVYYFWVKNKNTAPNNKSMSIQQATSLLTAGPSLYMTFHDILGATGSLPTRYDAVSIFGLNRYVTRDDTYKLRFTRNFTLRDDPNELDLKNVHNEWTLLRPGQSTRIPLNLWNQMVDSAVGMDSVGNPLPYTYLKDYDNQNGTKNSYGLGTGQVLADASDVIASIKHTILNTTLTIKLGNSSVPDYIQNIDLSQLDKYFDSPQSIRKTLDFIWREAKSKQINEIFFDVVNIAMANNFEFKDIFKTSRLSVYSIKTLDTISIGTSDE